MLSVRRRCERLIATVPVATVLAGSLSACSALPGSYNPVEWWRGLQGGAIAEQRPPPPGADQPYPNLASVPSRPAPPDMKLHQQIADALATDRATARRDAEAAPLRAPTRNGAAATTGSPLAFAGGSPPQPPAAAPADTASASLAAATAPPAPPAATPTGTTPPTTAAAPAPAAPPVSVAASPAVSGAAPGAGKTTGAGSNPVPADQGGQASLAPPASADDAQAAPNGMPAFAAAPPAPPRLPGAPSANNAGRSASVDAAPPAAPPAPAEPRQVGDTVPIAFPAGSADLPADGATALRKLAAGRHNAAVMVSGFGEAASPDPRAQSGALTLALNRAEAMAAALSRAGVPAGSVRVDAQAAGRGGAARLVE